MPLKVSSVGTGPYAVVGAVGAIPASVRTAIDAGREDWATTNLGTDRVHVRSTGRMHFWEAGAKKGLTWGVQGDLEGLATWEDAMHVANAPGVAVDADGVTIHASSWGFQYLHVTQIGEHALAFATTIDALVDLIEGPLDPDWDAWASILSMYFPVDGRTPFQHVSTLLGSEHRRLTFATRRVSAHCGVPRDVGADRAPAEPGEITERLRQSLAHHPALNDASSDGYLAALPLSGGYDSRLLGVLATQVHSPDRFLSLTSSKHLDGDDPDVRFGLDIGRHLGLTQQVVAANRADYPAYAARSFSLTEYESAEHAWFQPTVDRLHALGRPVIDGLIGDLLLRNGRSTATLNAFTDRAVLGTAIWQNLTRTPRSYDSATSPKVLSELESRTLSGLDSARAIWAGQPNEVRLSLMRTRSSDGVGLAPFKMIAAGAEVVAPFLHPGTIAAALSVHWQEKEQAKFSRSVLDSAEPGLSSLPSTVFPGTFVATGRRRSNSPESVAWTTERIDVLSQLASDIFRDTDIRRLHDSRRESWRHGLMLLSCWLERYAHRLSSTSPPWWS